LPSPDDIQRIFSLAVSGRSTLFGQGSCSTTSNRQDSASDKLLLPWVSAAAIRLSYSLCANKQRNRGAILHIGKGLLNSEHFPDFARAVRSVRTNFLNNKKPLAETGGSWRQVTMKTTAPSGIPMQPDGEIHSQRLQSAALGGSPGCRNDGLLSTIAMHQDTKDAHHAFHSETAKTVLARWPTVIATILDRPPPPAKPP